MAHRQLVVELSGDALPDVESFLEQSGALAITLTDAGDEPVLEPRPGETPLWTAIRLHALFAPDASVERTGEELRARFPTLASIGIDALPERDWVRAWLDDFQPMRFGSRLWICPTGRSSGLDDAIEVVLDPGLAFGTGTHPTTALCLEWLESIDLAGNTVIDYGCGSGILSIAALKLGAASVAATDIDPQALAATHANAIANGVDRQLSAALPVDFRPDAADILVANILAAALIDLAPVLTGLAKPGARIALSGVLHDQADEVMACYADRVKFDPVVRRGDWVVVSGRRI